MKDKIKTIFTFGKNINIFFLAHNLVWAIATVYYNRPDSSKVFTFAALLHLACYWLCKNALDQIEEKNK